MFQSTDSNRRVPRKRSRPAKTNVQDIPLPSIAPLTRTTTSSYTNTGTLLTITAVAVGLLWWRNWRQGQQSKSNHEEQQSSAQSSSSRTSSSSSTPQPSSSDRPSKSRQQGSAFNKMFGAAPDKPKAKPVQDPSVTTTNVPRNKQRKHNKRGPQAGVGKKHDNQDDLPEYESQKFDTQQQAWVHSKTKFDRKGGKVVMHKESTTYSKE